MLKEQFDQWKQHKITIEFFKELQDRKDIMQERINNSEILFEKDALLRLNRWTGYVHALNDIFNTVLKDEEDITNEENVRSVD